MVLPIEMEDDLCLRCNRNNGHCPRAHHVLIVALEVGEPHKVTECDWFVEGTPDDSSDSNT